MSLRYKRSDRVADLIHREISDLFMRKIKDPRLTDVTITGVELTDDLRIATVFFTRFSGVTEEIERGLRSAVGMIRKEIGARLVLKYVPEIRFRHDTSFEYAERIESLLRKVQDEPGEGG